MSKQDTMTKYRAERILGLDQTYSVNDLNAAYREAVRINHPDSGGDTDKMIELNAAKEYLDGFFEADRKRRIEPSTSERDSADIGAQVRDEAKKAGHGAQEAAEAAEAARTIADIFNDAYATNGSEKDAPFYEGADYTKKPQAEWSDEEWIAFREFRPPVAYDTAEYAVERMKSWSQPHQGRIIEAGNINVADWRDTDWYYYWFSNSRNPREDGRVYTRSAPRAYSGPLAEKDHARRHKEFWKLQNTYAKMDGVRVQTFYGPVDSEKFENMGRNGNVGVPFAFALVEDYDLWYDMNIEAENEAKAFASKRDRRIDPGHVKGTWSGREWLKPEDAHFFDDLPTAPGPYGAGGTQRTGAVGNGSATAHEATRKAQDAGRLKMDVAGAEASWEARCAKARTAPYRNMGIQPGGADKRLGNGCDHYNRNAVPGMPGWYRALNAILNRTPWRTVAWIVFALVFAVKAFEGADGMDIGFTLLIGVMICGINQTGYFTNMVRGLLRGLLDGALKIWARATKTDIDWIAARAV